MLVRHNTALLEKAVDLVVKQAAIPTLEAEAAAYDRMARANAFRRMMTGAAVAVAAVGIGYGAALFFGREIRPPVAPDKPVEKHTDRLDPSDMTTQPKSVRTDPPKEAKPVEPSPAPLPKPDKVTEDFNKFLTKEVDFGGAHWTLTSGHYFTEENDPTWDRAWCYTRRLVNGVDVNTDLVNRLTPTATPQAPIAPPATLASVGLNDDSARELASKCAWLDGKAFSPADFELPSGRAEAAKKLIAQDGWDAMGFDLQGMPLMNLSFDQCQTRCEGDDQCQAITYDKKHSACFLKGDASILVRAPDAAMAAKPAVASKVEYSSLVFYKNTVVVGDSYSNEPSNYASCVTACAVDQKCLGFNFDGPNNMCSMLNQVSSLSVFKGVASGTKAAGNQ
ncbi:MAG: hypothetical protein EOS76_10950 [Mesorhizobium sp.]|uniref:PAN domain-containing protein n=1 Tax=unclassified Mesorhizobium TaxID=325217 RepID=UPI000F74DBA7|nr:MULTISPECIES: PAN domain-containing protein [unclassified Mesorhizobium]RVC82509.1 hypothetical protein EN766_00875 [Mesorhizobium sp. M2A.F.Ca.ET.046.02.1.1]AZO34112.1 hypothetical protein EJ072_06105 [Mesorhizobium sp. M2A.F.Ca.ET.046.03.2.1]AZO71540.1 hypothetical protein EJ067_10485 [Mesorhizobium sp. M1D.F.Ca.ET.043.01.1.1]RWB39382.1 MAG: hypothetical protein EOQ44_28185 [Mesorhizobium sp.]RWE19706.1 MAG: hypothetical protein EOS76_10950 [Mesorhizobium sp.]